MLKPYLYKREHEPTNVGVDTSVLITAANGDTSYADMLRGIEFKSISLNFLKN